MFKDGTTYGLRTAGLAVFGLVILITGYFLGNFVISQLTSIHGNETSQEKGITLIPPVGEGEHIKWSGDSSRTIIEYFDLDCPTCRVLFSEEKKLPLAIKEKIRLIYRPFPLINIHPRSLERMIIAECVYNDGGDKEYFAFIDLFFKSYQEGTQNNDWVMRIAKNLVVNEDSFNTCVKQEDPIEKINTLRAGAAVSIVFSTPTLILVKDGMPVIKYNLLGTNQAIRIIQDFATSP